MSSNATLRRCVVFLFAAVYLLVGVPLWYKLTTIYRAQLPMDYIKSLHENRFQDVHMTIPVYIKSNLYRFPDIHDAVQIQVNHLLNSKRQYVPWSLQILPYDEQLLSGEQKDAYHVVELDLDDFVGYYLPYDTKRTVVYFDDPSVVANDLPFFVAQTLIEHTFALEWDHLSHQGHQAAKRNGNSISINYSPNVHLSISLLNGDGTPVAWEISETLVKYFTPFREMLSPIVNFTVDTSIVFHNDLNLHTLSNSTDVTWQDLAHVIDLSELSSSVYYSEQNALNLAIVFPSAKLSPQGLPFINGTGGQETTAAGDNWDSFIVPQWGVLIVNKDPLEENTKLKESYLSPIMYKFAKDIFQLLGLADTVEDLSSLVITMDSFKRLTILQNMDNAVETLWSLLKLTESFEQMSIPLEVRNNVTEALDLRLAIVDDLNNPELGSDAVWDDLLLKSNRLVQLCESSFFHGEMVQQNFFPQEHKVAVYLPLLGPITVVIFIGLVANLKESNAKPEDQNKELTKNEEEEKRALQEAEGLHAVDGEDEIVESTE